MKIKNYGCIKHAELIARNLTVIIGPNGSGKTTLLEVMYLGRSKGGLTPLGINGIDLVIMARSYQIPAKADAWVDDIRITTSSTDPLLDIALGKKVKIVADLAGDEVGRIYIGDVTAAAVFRRYVTSVSRATTNAVYISPALADIYLKFADRPDAGSTGAMWTAAVTTALNLGDVVYIDNLDAYLHPHSIQKLAEAVKEAVRQGKQVVATVNTIEAIDALTEDADGVLIRMKNCAIYDVMEFQDVRDRLKLHDDVRFY